MARNNNNKKKRDYFSYSQLKSFTSCSYTYYQVYVLGNRDEGNKYSALGNAVHEAFENMYELGDVTKVLEEYRKFFMKIPHSFFESNDEHLEFFKRGVKMVKAGYARFIDQKPVHLELKMHVRVLDDELPVLAFLDRIDGDPENAATWEITDYKSSKNKWPRARLREEFQLGFYAMLIHAQYGEYPAALQYYFPCPDEFVRAEHMGDGVYEYTNQRQPALQFSVDETREKVKEILEEIRLEKFDLMPCGTFFCKNYCPHYVSDGWGGIG